MKTILLQEDYSQTTIQHDAENVILALKYFGADDKDGDDLSEFCEIAFSKEQAKFLIAALQSHLDALIESYESYFA